VLPFTDGGAGISLVVSHCRRWQALREDVTPLPALPAGAGGFDIGPHLVVSHEPEADLKVGVARAEPVSHPSRLLGVRMVVLIDPPVVGAAGDFERLVDLLGIDLRVEKVAEQGF
jgi:hypothetical protein